MNFDDIKSILAGKRVGIAGAGGLGSNCASALVRCGLGNLVIADFDKVEISNLNRQFYFMNQVGIPKVEALKTNLLRIYPDVNIVIHNILIDPTNIAGIFDGVEVLVEALDQADQKEMLIESALEKWPDRPLVVGSGMAGFGKTEKIRIKKYDQLYICGDEIEEIGPENPPLAPRIGIVANMQDDAVLEILLKT